MSINNTADLIKNGLIKAVGYDYQTKDGLLIRRVTVGRRTTKWQRADNRQIYRSLFEAYFDVYYR